MTRTSITTALFKNAGLFSQLPRRALSNYIQSIHPNIGKIYSQLLHQKEGEQIPCNFAFQVLDKWAKNPNQMAICCFDRQERNPLTEITYREVKEQSLKINSFFNVQGFKKGDNVALMLGQRLEWWYSLAALVRAGIGIVPCSRLLTSKDLSYRINDLGIRGIITTPELQDRIDEIRDECPILDTALTTGKAVKNWYSLLDILNTHEVQSAQQVTTTTQDPCLYLYTSGTTGQPKAVQHNQDYPFFHWPTGRRWLQATPEDLVFNASDTGWGFTVWITTAVWSMGAKLLIAPTNKKFNAQEMLALLQQQPVTIFCAAPTVLRLLVAEPNFNEYRFTTLKRIVTVGEALDETVIQKFHSRGIQVSVGFGQAETPLIIGRVDDQPHEPGTMGKPIDPYKVVLLDEHLKPVSPGESGEICLDLKNGSGGGIMRGYVNAPDKNQSAFSPDNKYYFTGDYAKYGTNGALFYQGRRDDLIKSRGYRIGPDEVEKAGMTHPAVAKIAVVGVHTDINSTAITVKAFILLKPHYEPTQELMRNIQNHIKKETGPYKYPRLIEFLTIKEWEKFETTSGKIRRRGLREQEEERIKINAQRNEDNYSTPVPSN